MIQTRLSDICKWADAICPAGFEDIVINDICKDSRLAKPGSLFIPLSGARFDGHDFINAAVKSGASASLYARDDITSGDIPLIRVRDVLEAFQAIAAGYRHMFDLKVIGITGSVGKTTTALMTSAALGSKYRVIKTEEDSNGQIGLPFAMFKLSDEYDAAVLEMGMSQPGELTRLSRIASPDIAVINTIGTAHIEFFGTREKILEAKLEILQGLASDGTVVLNADEPLLWALRGKLDFNTLYYGVNNPDTDLKAAVVSQNDGITTFDVYYGGETERVNLPASGLHNAQNALAALAVALTLGIGLEEAARSLENYLPAKGRQNIYTKNGITIIDDSYNASPDSVQAALGILKQTHAGHRIAVLGGMLELGGYSDEGHEICGAAAAECADFLFLYGEGSEAYRRGALHAGMDERNIEIFENHESLAQKILETTENGDAVLFKGSHAMNISSVIQMFVKKL